MTPTLGYALLGGLLLYRLAQVLYRAAFTIADAEDLPGKAAALRRYELQHADPVRVPDGWRVV